MPAPLCRGPYSSTPPSPALGAWSVDRLKSSCSWVRVHVAARRSMGVDYIPIYNNNKRKHETKHMFYCFGSGCALWRVGTVKSVRHGGVVGRKTKTNADVAYASELRTYKVLTGGAQVM